MKCSACGAQLPTNAFPGAELTCACGARHVVGAPIGKPVDSGFRSGTSAYRTAAPASDRAPSTALRCPRCRTDLEGDPAACARCGGLFLDHPTLATRVEDADARRSGVPFAPGRPFDPDIRDFECPACRQRMERSAFGQRSGIFLDACGAHGTWFDRGELDNALDYVRAIGLDAIRAADRAEREREPPSEPKPSSRAKPAERFLDDSRELRMKSNLDSIARGGGNLLSFVLRHFVGRGR